MSTNIKTRDGLSLYCRIWEAAKPKAVMCLIHGLGEHCGRYEHVASAMTQYGYHFMAIDLRGHGRSEGKRGHTSQYDCFMDDIELFIEDAKIRYPALPIILYGHSLGGNLVINYALRRKSALQGLIVTSPALRPAFTPPSWKMALGKFANIVAPSVTMSNEIDVNHLSNDPSVIDRYIKDPLVHNQISPRLGLGLIASGEWALQQKGALSAPLLLMHGEQDKVTSSQASDQFSTECAQQCELKIWPNMQHELHNESIQDELFAKMHHWITLQIGS